MSVSRVGTTFLCFLDTFIGISVDPGCPQVRYERNDTMAYDIKNVEMKDEFKVCPSCGYEDGFHTMFKKYGGTTKWLFICPACHQVFDIGFSV